MDRTRLLIILIILLIGLDGCRTLDKKRAEKSLESTLRSYEITIRWGELTEAYSFLKAEIAIDNAIPEGLDNVRVTKYEVVQPAVNIDENTVVQTANIEYLFRDRQVVRSLNDRQVWELDKESNKWYRINPIAEFK